MNCYQRIVYYMLKKMELSGVPSRKARSFFKILNTSKQYSYFILWTTDCQFKVVVKKH